MLGSLRRLPVTRWGLIALAVAISAFFVPIQTTPSPLWTLSEGVKRDFAGTLPYSRGGLYAMSGVDLGAIMRSPSGSWKHVVVIVPHRDDETLFLGETLAALDAAGVDVTVIFTTTSQGGRKMNPRFRADRQIAYDQVASLFGIDDTFVSNIPDGAPLGGFTAKAKLTEQFVEGTDAIKPGSVLFTIGGRGHYDHWVAEYVGRRLAAKYKLPLFVYWGYGPRHKYLPAADKNWGPQMRPVDFAAGHFKTALEKKREAILMYRYIYLSRGWERYWVSISIFELSHADEVGFVPAPMPMPPGPTLPGSRGSARLQ